jgi:hypothetical protein
MHRKRCELSVETIIVISLNYASIFLPDCSISIRALIFGWRKRCFLLGDRLIIDQGPRTDAQLMDVLEDEQLYKLIGVSRKLLNDRAGALIGLYRQAGGLERLKGSQVPGVGEIETSEGTAADWLDQEESDEAVERSRIEIQAQVRDRKKAAALKRHYDNSCAICGLRLQIGEARFYSEAAHIQPLGKPHNGPDKASNILVLCPNHHLQFDRGVLLLRKHGAEYLILSRVKGDPVNRTTLRLKHNIDDLCVQWHRKWFATKRQ